MIEFERVKGKLVANVYGDETRNRPWKLIFEVFPEKYTQEEQKAILKAVNDFEDMQQAVDALRKTISEAD